MSLIKHSDELGELYTALSAFQTEVINPKKDQNAGQGKFSYKYADLSEVWDAIRKPLTKQGLSIEQMPDYIDGTLFIATTLAHKSGQYKTGYYPVIPTKQDPQGLGSAYTYARRYSLLGAVGIHPENEDDDGKEGSETPVNTKVQNAKTGLYERPEYEQKKFAENKANLATEIKKLYAKIPISPQGTGRLLGMEIPFQLTRMSIENLNNIKAYLEDVETRKGQGRLNDAEYEEIYQNTKVA